MTVRPLADRRRHTFRRRGIKAHFVLVYNETLLSDVFWAFQDLQLLYGKSKCALLSLSCIKFAETF